MLQEFKMVQLTRGIDGARGTNKKMDEIKRENFN